jgi:large subunit ribosomal protein L33
VFGSRKNKPRRVQLTLSCPVCGTRNYRTSRPVKEGTEPLVLSKFCKTCGHHTEHREAK